MANKIEFSPAIPIPLVFDVQKRIQELRSYLDPNNPNYQPEQQHINIKAAIKALRGRGDRRVAASRHNGRKSGHSRGGVQRTCVGLGRGTFFQVPPFYKNSSNEWGSNYRECIISMLKSLPTVMGLLVPTVMK
jgi:hypothetical protein